MCVIAFNNLGLDYRDYLIDDQSFYRPQEGMKKIGDATKSEH